MISAEVLSEPVFIAENFLFKKMEILK